MFRLAASSFCFLLFACGGGSDDAPSWGHATGKGEAGSQSRPSGAATNQLAGAVLVGDIAPPLFESNDHGQSPSDWYYQDLDGDYQDVDFDGLLELPPRSIVHSREIWTGRLFPPTAAPDRIGMLRRYFDRNHRLR